MYLSDLQSGNQYKITVLPNSKSYVLTYITQQEKYDEYDTEFPYRSVKGKVVEWRYEKSRFYWTNLLFCDGANTIHFFSDKQILQIEPYFMRRV
jgi:hypothetical protein